MTKPSSSQIPTLSFFGAAGTVTGSRFMLTTPESKTLVDCGLFQGLKELRLRNWDRFPIEPSTIDTVLLSHAHLDHSGYIPGICRDGFRGRIVATESTRALCGILLPDSGHLQEEESDYANRKGYSRHSPAEPLYTEDDARRALEQFTPVEYDSPFAASPGIRATFRYAGHILGASSVLVELTAKRSRRVLFSGDLGRPHHPILRPPAPLPEADLIVVESTYGDRRHDDAKSLENFENAITRTAARGGVIVIPSFAVDRTEVILFHLHKLISARRIPDLPIFVDSPMALAALKLYKDRIAARSDEMLPGIGLDAFEAPHLSEVRTVQESMTLNSMAGPMLIISASGMATGGRVLHHLANRLPDERNAVILVGFQADGTRGRALLEGATTIKMLGRYVAVRAEVVNVPAFSVHADQSEILGWLRTARRAPETCFVVHGEPAAAGALCDAIRKQLGWNAVAPRHLERVRLD
ncbi:MAG TPA: MBL fold metallo-hydrolase [Candidatus Acidoferrales bacterium]|nr:MBL fold metallo-hydrolase [Candidatus Acidoferrales bacterium]